MQTVALNLLKLGENIFLTGAAGTGKTYILNQYIFYLKSRKVIPTVVAPTGIAASHLQGQTIHSYFSLGVRDNIDQYFVDNLLKKKYLKTRFNKLKVLIIDEISMVSPNLFSAIDMILQAFKQNNKPFGGIQVIVCGDFFQLPPISNNNNGKKFAWQSPSWKKLDLQSCYLERKFRQNDDKLIFILDQIRNGDISQTTYDLLNSRVGTKLDIDFTPTKLYTHNLDVDKINNQEIEKLSSKPYIFESKNEGSRSNIEKLFKSSLVQEQLTLKKDAVVMFIKNIPEKYIINGTTGVVIDFSKDDLPIVKLSNGYIIKVDYEDWSIENENGKITAKVSQIPLKLAWAITIHKSQGMTLDAAQIDLSRTFELSQGYVALSRIKDLDGVQLIGYNDIALKVDPLILKIDPMIKQASLKAKQKVENLNKQQLELQFISYINRLGGVNDQEAIKDQSEKLLSKQNQPLKQNIATHLQTKQLISELDSLDQIANKRGLNINTIISHIITLKKEDPTLDISKFLPPLESIDLIKNSYDTILKSNNPDDLTQDGKIKLKSIFTYLDGKVSYNDIKLVLL